MLKSVLHWIEKRKAQRRQRQADAQLLIMAEEANAYYEAQRRATRARVDGDRQEFFRWASVAAEIARISPHAEMDMDVLKRIVDAEERRRD
ncbi:hypothetical protein [Neoaquamicrobium sediminum]|uniref:hypothetical protein n=1 Tax=Neoaquamicrobium sediminum TaxID=1849104 RepID=UPI001567A7D3|nr:hypothetical protein [Mesorhizobium sediminum]NRC57319.1 hypothetical protein [Mesorhizobium sediminum]